MKEKKIGWASFLKLCHHSTSIKQCDAIFHLLFTAEERDQLADRVLLVRELLKGEKTQRQIAADLNISIAKITRGSNQLKETNEDVKQHFLNAIDH
ncbi:MAG: trp operon repressor [Pseudomonadota bacterium]